MKKHYSIFDVDNMVNHVIGTMRLEGIILTDEDINRLRDLAENRITIEEAVEDIIKKYCTVK